MKKTNKILSIILAILMIVTTIPMAFAADIVNSGTFHQSNIEWTLDSDNVLTISGEGSMGTYAGYAFNSSVKSRIEEVIIEDGVTDVARNLFTGCSRLTSVYIADSVKIIESAAFKDCTALTNVYIGDSVETIGDDAFRNCDALTRIYIGSGVKDIGYNAFMTSDSYVTKVVHYNGTQNMWNNITMNMTFPQRPDLHYLEKISKPATCFEDGQEVLVCTKCNDTFKSKVIPASHTLEAVEAKAPTCTEAGYDAYEYCTACDYSTKVEKEALNHKDTLETVEAKAPTCTEIGWDAYEYCTACDYTTYVEKAALSHDIVIDEAVAATCTETGLTAGQHCSRCDDMTIIQETVPVLTHTDADSDGKCDNGGEQLTCEDCGRPVHEEEGIPQYICWLITLIKMIVSFFK